ncbi:hypothetical protein N0V83_009082 [Neocucurbitaria cava]|uniref:Uncharacterized protein n=1 Tax=Neocucurbitaria cava TaxID=798079 RepID=A0A9W8Y064_9PLEO|nr:hypothetical protein N0V83_009082 [Neocucurbitaria cava]
MAAANLAPLPQPGLPIFPGFTAQKPCTFLMKGQDLWSNKASFLISHASPSGEAGAAFLEIREREKNQISFLTTGGGGDGDGREVMRIVKKCHSGWSKSKSGTEYHGLRGDGTEAWCLKLHSGWSGTDFAGHDIQVQNKILGQEKGILMDGNPVATMSRHEAWSHMARHDLIHVAPGMDILLALGVNWVRADKQKRDTQAVVALA